MLKKLREEKGLTKAEISKKANIEYSSWTRYENDNQTLLKANTYTSYLIAQILDIKLDELVKAIIQKGANK